MPLLTFAGLAVRQRGWRVRAVSWSAPELDTASSIDWVGTQLENAIGDYAGPVLVVGKSLGTCGADLASHHGWPAIWLTPLLDLPEIVEAMARNPGRQLLVGGTLDPAWDVETAHTISPDVLQVVGADHGMFAHDAVRSAELHVDVTRAIARWLDDVV
ncbi:MAG TPA: hypothetical protein VLS91_02960 [Acidimicrobiales bacterium]|nr:hypothetical protein [Acidimicrobiales bacterium]